MSVDLHTHTTHSDGTTAPTVNVALAAAEGLSGVAITDHDTTAGWEEAAAACTARGVRFVPGLELSTEAPVGAERAASVHVLGYWVDPDHPELVAELARLRGERDLRAERMVARLAVLGVAVDLERVRAIAGTAPIGRPHVAAAMVETGAVEDRNAAFDRYLAEGRPAYVAKQALDPADGVALIRRAGGVAVLAHPTLSLPVGPQGEAVVDRMVAAGLAGLELDSAAAEDPERPELAEAVRRWRAVAAERDLLVTGSSDFHGERKDVPLGARTTAPAVVAALEELRGKVSVGTDVPESEVARW